jgi:hypothetical protein
MLACGFGGAVAAADAARVPEVYRDDYVSVRAGVEEVGQEILHFGDLLTLTVSVTFNPSSVRIQTLDEAVFKTAWMDEPGIRLMHVQTVETDRPDRAGKILSDVEALYRFQILACPKGAATCRGVREYRIPAIGLQYQLVNEAGAVLSSRSIRVEPWPASLRVSSALPLVSRALEGFPVYFPDDAYVPPQALPTLTPVVVALVATGVVGLVFTVAAGGLRWGLPGFLAGRSHATRWERVREQLRKEAATLSPEQFRDKLRRAITWYCVDELGIDPYTWVKQQAEQASRTGEDGREELRALYLDVVGEQDGENQILLDRFARISRRSRRR